MRRDTEMSDFAALEEEGRRRGLSYGKLVAATYAYERDEIIRKYRRASSASKKKKDKRAPAE